MNALVWLNEPPTWEWSGDELRVTTAPASDFWRRTHDDFIRDSGHFLAREVSGDFTAQVRFSGDFPEQYDQAGLMVRASATTWVKAGIERVDGVPYASVVVTRDFSDWSMVGLDETRTTLSIRISRTGGTLTIERSDDGQWWEPMRQCWLSEDPTLEVGPMCASPDGSGFEVSFTELRIDPAG